MTELEVAMTAEISKTGYAMHTKSLQSCSTLCDPMDCSPQAPLSIRKLPHLVSWLAVPTKQKSVLALSHDSVLNGDLPQGYLIGET